MKCSTCGGLFSQKPSDIERMLYDACARHPKGQAGWAREHGVSPQFVNDVLSGRRAVTNAIANVFGFERATIFVRSDASRSPTPTGD